MPPFPLWKTILVLVVVSLFGYFAAASFVPAEKRDRLPESMRQFAVNLGLDLRGGSHLLLAIDFPAYFREQNQQLRGIVRSGLKESQLLFRDLAATGDHVTFTLPADATSRGGSLEKFRRALGRDYSVSEEGGRVSVGMTEEAIASRRQQLIDQSIEIVNRRVNESGTKEPIIQRQGEDRILLQVPGLDDPEQLKRILGKTAKMTFHLVNLSVSPEDVAAGRAPLGTKILPHDKPEATGNTRSEAVYAEVELTGESLTGASATLQNGQPVVSFQFDQTGARKFADITRNNVGKPFAVVLDDKIVTAPRINGAILGGSGIIEGNFTVESANDLALLLRAGSLPAPLRIVEERSVGPSLGADSVQDGMRAGLVGLAAVMLFMIVGYGLFGLFADVALLANIVLLIGALGLFQATLTLPGIAGIVLTFGMAVDANVLIYERIREEMSKGRSAVSAVETGFKLAFGTIMDSNMTSLIAAAILYQLGTGPVKGFAVTLALGILCSMFTAIMVTRMQIAAWFRLRRPKTLPL